MARERRRSRIFLRLRHGLLNYLETTAAAQVDRAAQATRLLCRGGRRRRSRRGRRRRLSGVGRLPSAVFEWAIQRIAEEDHHPTVIGTGQRIALHQRQFAAEQ